MNRRHTTRLFGALVLWLLAAPGVHADTPAAWRVQGQTGTVVLLGSIHMLPERLGRLPDSIERLYGDADSLVMELDLANLDPLALQGELNRLGAADSGRTLPDYMDRPTWQHAQRLATDIGLDLSLFAPLRPWLAAMTVTQMRLMQLGFVPQHGLDMQLTARAVEDSKPLSGLETAAEQLAIFSELSDGEQVELLLQSLEDAATLEHEMAGILEAWSTGDTGYLEDELLGTLRESPSLYDSVVVKRNRAWIAPLEALLDEPGTHLVVVGALHLVGDDSVVALLQARGHRVQRL